MPCGVLYVPSIHVSQHFFEFTKALADSSSKLLPQYRLIHVQLVGKCHYHHRPLLYKCTWQSRFKLGFQSACQSSFEYCRELYRWMHWEDFLLNWFIITFEILVENSGATVRKMGKTSSGMSSDHVSTTMEACMVQACTCTQLSVRKLGPSSY